jgi:hypothetical protein
MRRVALVLAAMALAIMVASGVAQAIINTRSVRHRWARLGCRPSQQVLKKAGNER